MNWLVYPMTETDGLSDTSDCPPRCFLDICDPIFCFIYCSGRCDPDHQCD